jgi:hypothetical protein
MRQPCVRSRPNPALAALALTALSLPFAAPVVAAATAPPALRVYQTAHVNPHSPKIDGRFDDPAWDKVAWETGFVQREPYEGQPPSQSTSFKILYDDDSLYVAVKAHDTEPARIERRMSRRDDIEGDWIEVGIDSFHDHRTAFCFGVNAAGVKRDAMAVNDSNWDDNTDLDWDPIWEVETAVDADGWTAEMRIPFTQLRFARAPDASWGLQVSRRLFRKNERSLWQHIPKDAAGWVSFFGELHGLAGIKPPRQVELFPYAVGKLQGYAAEPGNPFATGRSRSLYGGLDGKIGVSGDLTLNFTLNPDFGQVEADPSVVNLTAFETYYEEKRPFFIEGRNILSFKLMGGDGDMASDNLFYTRRIGRSPQYYPEADGFVRTPEATTILGAFKLTGKTRSGWSVGVIESLTGEERASVFADGVTDRVTVEPLTNYLGLRLQKDFNRGGTTVGGMVTAVNRRLADAHMDFLHDRAYAGGLDLYHSWRNKTYYFSLKLLGSTVHGSPEALLRTQTSPLRYYQRPDAEHVEVDPDRRSLSGFGGTAEFGKQGGGHLMYSVGTTWRSPGFELNDMGFLGGADEIMQWIWAGYRVWKPFAVFRTLNVNFNQWTGWNFGGTNIFAGGNINVNAQFKNYWSGGFGLNRNFIGLSSAMLRGGPSMRMPGAWNFWGNVQTDMRRKVRFTLMGQGSRRDNGESQNLSLSGGIIVNPSRAFSVSLLPTLGLNESELQYISTPTVDGAARYVFGRIEQKTFGLTVRLNYSLTPDLSVQLYGQPFVAAGGYSRFKRIADPKSRIWANRYRVFGEDEIAYDEASHSYGVDEDLDGAVDFRFDRPDFNFFEFRSNLVVRWEYRPGSALFLVWSQGRTGSDTMGDFRFGRDFGSLFDVAPHNVFLVKFSYGFQL